MIAQELETFKSTSIHVQYYINNTIFKNDASPCARRKVDTDIKYIGTQGSVATNNDPEVNNNKVGA